MVVMMVMKVMMANALARLARGGIDVCAGPMGNRILTCMSLARATL